MKTAFAILLALALGHLSVAQSKPLQDSTLFDFWVGHWTLTWVNADGKTAKGTNHIVKILDGKVIQENFSDEEGKLKGMSLSVYNPTKKTWHQAWADSQGGYFNFEGLADGQKRIFKTEMRAENGKKIMQRMVFYDIKPSSLTWDWESTADGGNTWQLLWRINYARKEG
jgi:hypothetical protein